MGNKRSRKRSVKNRLAAFIVLAAMVAVMCGCYVGVTWFIDNTPNKEIISQGELFGVSGEADGASGDELVIFLNGEQEEIRGISRDGRAFLPYEWVTEKINPTFYVDSAQNLILYTMPEEVLYYGEDDLIYEEDSAYLSLEVVNHHTELEVQAYLGDEYEVKRLFLWKDQQGYETLGVTDATLLHVGDSIKAKAVRELAEGETLRLLEDPNADAEKLPARAMVKVQTQDGFIGWVLRRCLDDQPQQAAYESTFEEPVYTNISLPYKLCLAWHQVDNKSANAYITKLLEGTEGVNVVSPTWFSLQGNAGEFNSRADKSYVEKLHDMGIQVWGLVDNFDTSVSSVVLLSDMTARGTLVKNLVAAAQEYDLDGINIDFEEMPRAVSEHFAQFIRELSVEAHKYGLIVSVDNPNTQDFNLYYRRDVQGTFADYVINMGYDEHYSGGAMGSVASYPFVYEGIMMALDEVPAEKLVGAVPFYTRIWKQNGSKTTSKAVGLDTAAKWVGDNNVELTWDSDKGQYVGQCTTSDGESYIWMEDAESLKLKVNLFKEQGLAGIAVWRLGFATEDGWQAIKW